MIYDILDLFAGIGSFYLGIEQTDHYCIDFCEIDEFARRSYKAIHDTRKEMEIHDITKCIRRVYLIPWTSRYPLQRISIPSFFSCGKAAKIF